MVVPVRDRARVGVERDDAVRRELREVRVMEPDGECTRGRREVGVVVGGRVKEGVDQFVDRRAAVRRVDELTNDSTLLWVCEESKGGVALGVVHLSVNDADVHQGRRF